MGHGRAEPDVIDFDELLTGSGLRGNGETGGVLAATGGDILPIPNTTQDAVGLGEMDGGEDEVGFIALLSDDPSDEGGGFVHEEFLVEPITGIVEAPEAGVGWEPIGVDNVHDVHRRILLGCRGFERGVKMNP